MGAIKHAFQNLGHDIADAAKDVGKGLEAAGKDIEKVGKGIVEGVESVGKTLAKDVASTAEAAIQSADALMHGHLQDALNKAMEAGHDLVKTGSDLGSAGTQVALDSLSHMHLSKKMDNVMGKVEKGFDSVKNDVTKSVDQVADQVVSGTEGAIKGTVDAVNDAAHGKWGAAAGALGGAAMDAVNVAADLTPEGAAAAVGTQMLSNAHIGSQQLDSAIGGALHGNFTQMAKGVVKNVSEMEVGNKASELASKVLPQGGSGGENAALLGAGLGFAAEAAGSGSKRSRGGEAGGGETHSYASSEHSGKTGAPEGADSREAKKQKKEDADDNARTAANNRVANQPGQTGGNSALEQELEQELMLESFLSQAGMGGGSGAQKRRAEVGATS
jgi:hypothetical protein